MATPGAKQAAFWVGVTGLGAVLGPVLFNLAADKAGDKVPGLRELNDYATRRNG